MADISDADLAKVKSAAREEPHAFAAVGPIGVVVPALEAAQRLPAALASLRRARAGGLIGDVLVVDGGSTDDTAALAAAGGARMIMAPRGRGIQLRAGAAEVGGPWLLFLHADTTLGEGREDEVARLLASPVGRSGEIAAVFRFALDDDAPQVRRLERIVAWRTRRLGLPYGDQGLLIARRLYDAIGGYAAIPLMEDVDIVRRIVRWRLVDLESRAVTSAARYRQTGYLRRSARNLVMLSLYFAGLPPRRLARLYG